MELCEWWCIQENLIQERRLQAVDGSLDLHSYAVPHPDVFWAYRFLEIKNWIVQWHSKSPNGYSWVSKNIWCLMHLGKDICVFWKDFGFKVFVDYIWFSFYVKYIWEKCYKNFFGDIFWGAHTIQMVPKYIWMQCCYVKKRTLVKLKWINLCERWWPKNKKGPKSQCSTTCEWCTWECWKVSLKLM